MKNGTCPKCNGHEIYRQIGNPNAPEVIALSGGMVNKGVAPTKYVCAQCGYLEYYLPLQGHIEVVRRHWEPVSNS